VGKPEIVTRGFVATPDAALLNGATDRIAKLLEGPGDRINEIALLKEKLKDVLSQYLYDTTRRRPMVMPVVVEV
jgi:ribonuclease J